MSSDTNRVLLPTRLVCERYNISDRTVDRWLESGILPLPLRINGIRYWRTSDLEQREQELELHEKRGRRKVTGDDTWKPLGDALGRVVKKLAD
jgi:hypothetical protein